MPEIQFKGVNIHFTEQGSGSAVVLLHGFLESSWIWKDITPSLAKNHRIICVDLPGHGLSDCVGYVHSMDEMADVVHEVLKSIKLRKAVLIGHSMGGYVALAFAEKYPDSVKSLILYQSTAKADSPALKKDRNRVIELAKTNHKAFIKKSIPMLLRPVNRQRLKTELNALKEEALKTSQQGIIAALSGMRDRPNREVLLKFAPYPVHIIAGDKDPRILFEESKSQAEISERVQFHVIKGSGHMSYIEDLPQTIERLREALR
ncbi:MAG: alpha/beta hydrolase [Flavobacteriales bacterium]